jgi:aconitate hydratase
MASGSFGTAAALEVGGQSYQIHRLAALAAAGLDPTNLPYSLKILLENLLRHEDGVDVSADDVEALVRFGLGDEAAEREIAFSPARILLQDFTGVPAVVDLAVVRDGVQALGGRLEAVNPLVPVDLVIDHSVIADESGTRTAFARNAELEMERNTERYRFLRWGAQAFDNFRVVPPDTGICHQINLEHLASVVFTTSGGAAYPDTLVGTDSHTPMVNGLGVLGWGVGGIEAEAALLGQPISMLIPRVIGFKLTGWLPEGTTATDLVLTVTEMLRRQGVVGKFVEFYGPGVANVPVENRATIGNMSPEYGSTVTIFPIDEQTLRYMRFTGRSEEQVALVEAYAKEQGLWHEPTAKPHYSDHLELDLSTVRPSLAGPSRPQDRVPLDAAKSMFSEALVRSLPVGETTNADDSRVTVTLGSGEEIELGHGHVVIAAITSCTNTSNPAVMIGAALLARHAVERGLQSRPWVKTSLAPGSRVVMDYYERAGLTPYLEKLGFNLVGFGCTTCIGNSGPLPEAISDAINEHGLSVVSVLSGNRNFEGRIHPDVRMSYLASPPLVVAYALAGTMDIDLYSEPLGVGTTGEDVYLRDIWPTDTEIAEVLRDAIRPEMFTTDYADVFTGDERWTSLPIPEGKSYAWDEISTYVRRPPFLDGMGTEPSPLADITAARALAVLGDSVTTDHISPAGSIRIQSPAGEWLIAHGVEPADFNSYGARRGNHEVMMRGTFANTRIRNQLAPGTEGGYTRHLPDGEEMTIFDAAQRYDAEQVPLVVLAGKEYGSGSSRDWAAKGTYLLGVRAVIAESFERIHRSNLIGMGVLPLQFDAGDSRDGLGLSGEEVFEITGIAGLTPEDLIGRRLTIRADGRELSVVARIDTLTEAEYYRHGGILPFIVRKLAAS